MAGNIPSGHHRDAAGHADGHRVKSVVKQNALFRQPVDVGRSKFWTAVAAKIILPLVIGHQKDDVGAIA
jgi:hypothetical protein